MIFYCPILDIIMLNTFKSHPGLCFILFQMDY